VSTVAEFTGELRLGIVSMCMTPANHDSLQLRVSHRVAYMAASPVSTLRPRCENPHSDERFRSHAPFSAEELRLRGSYTLGAWNRRRGRGHAVVWLAIEYTRPAVSGLATARYCAVQPPSIS
jgi:hypothetical protein